ncbi:MAG: ImmA/IrrE family metallo-endopeptidase, partial [Actinomycetota bacterium]
MHPADRLVEQLLARLGVAPAVPVDLEAVARGLGVAAVRTADLVEEGRLERTGGRTEILVRRGAPAARRRFTIAHELAHLLLEPGGTAERSARGERRCDEVAAALLMPRAWVASYEGRPRCLATARALAAEGGVSISAAVTRLDEVLGWRCGLLRFRRQDGRWRFLGACAVPASASAGIRSAPGTSSVLDDIARRSPRDTRTTVPVRVGDAVLEVPAEVSVRAGSALVLADAAALMGG